MENPFKYGQIVTGDDFVDRTKELSELEIEMAAGKSVLIFSNRRMGKTSLLAEFARKYESEFVFINIDLYGIAGLDELADAIVRETTKASFGKVEKIKSWVWDMLRSIRLRFVVLEDGGIGIDLVKSRPEIDDFIELLDLPEKIAQRQKKRIVMVFDEFQEIEALGGVSIIKKMRARFQHHKSVTYIFSGSKKHLLAQIFQEKEGAFFKFSRPMEIGPLPADELEGFLMRKFSEAGRRLSPKAAKKIVEFSRGYPYHSQQLAHELFSLGKSSSSADDVDEALSAVLDHESAGFSFLWESIKSPLQRRFLTAIANEPDSPHGEEFLKKYNLRSRSHAQKAETLLEKRGIIENGNIVDPFLAYWIRGLRSGS